MSASSIKNRCLALLFAFGVASVASAQLSDSNSPFYGYSNDLQFFDPVDLDLDGTGPAGPRGFFFSYEKVAWAATGERVEVGDPNTVQQAFQVYGGTPLDPATGQPIQRALLVNSIHTAVPRAVFRMGDRYEFGHWGEDNSGWLFSVLNGPDTTQTFNAGIDATPAETGGVAISPLGSVFVSFRTRAGNFAGFLDLDEGAGFEGILRDDANGDGFLEGDGFADDINENAQHGGQFFDLVAPGNEPDTENDTLPDYGDLVTLTTDYNQVNIRNTTKTNGFEIMRAYRLDNGHFKVSNQNNHFQWGYGARFLQIDDNFLFNGFDGFMLGDGRWDTTIVNNIVGPQVGYTWNSNHGRWTLQSVGKFMWGYNIRDWEQTGFVGEGFVPGAVNSPLYLRAKSFSYGKNDDDFSPVGELRLNVKYRVTDNISFKAGWTGTFVDNIKRAANHIDHVLYDNDGKVMGFLDGDTEELFSNGVNVGIEITQ